MKLQVVYVGGAARKVPLNGMPQKKKKALQRSGDSLCRLFPERNFFRDGPDGHGRTATSVTPAASYLLPSTSTIRLFRRE